MFSYSAAHTIEYFFILYFYSQMYFYALLTTGSVRMSSTWTVCDQLFWVTTCRQDTNVS